MFSPGSVATYARRSGIFHNHFIANFRENLPVKHLKNRLRFDRVTAVSLVSPFLLRHTVCFHIMRINFAYYFRTAAEMGPVALAGEPVRLRDKLRDDWSRRLGLQQGTNARRQPRSAHYRRLRFGAQRGQHRLGARPHPRKLQRGLDVLKRLH